MIYIVRHGETDLNKQGLLQGRKGLPLNEVGIKQAEE
jgi:probable phosphoglycerate mutase